LFNRYKTIGQVTEAQRSRCCRGGNVVRFCPDTTRPEVVHHSVDRRVRHEVLSEVQLKGPDLVFMAGHLLICVVAGPDDAQPPGRNLYSLTCPPLPVPDSAEGRAATE